MSFRHVVVDGSNIATEGRSFPSLAQLDEAVRSFLDDYPDTPCTVVVDATFGHRIDPSETEAFDEAEAANELVSPPAGAIGRGDAFVLRIAHKVGATILSNDSFQEFHGEYPWLFDTDRLIGGKPVPGIGWIFTPRIPVRGPKSRESVKEAKRKKGDPVAVQAAAPATSSGRGSGGGGRGKGREKKIERAVAEAVEEANAAPANGDGDGGKRRRRRGTSPPADPINEPVTFLAFVTAHRLNTEVEGTVDTFSSHGAYVVADGARCYVPLSAMADPPPRAARDALTRGEVRPFVVQAFDTPRRGIELALPGFARPAAAPTEETVEEELHPTPEIEPAAPAKRAPRSRKATPVATATGASEVTTAERAPTADAPTPKSATRARKIAAGPIPAHAAPVPTATPAKRAPAKRAPAIKAPATKTQATKAPATKAPATKAPAIKAPAIKAPATKSASAKRVTAAQRIAASAPDQPKVGRRANAELATPSTPEAASPAPGTAKRSPARKAVAAKAAATGPGPARKAVTPTPPAKRSAKAAPPGDALAPTGMAKRNPARQAAAPKLPAATSPDQAPAAPPAKRPRVAKKAPV